MQVVHERCAGLDVHKQTVVACVLSTHPDGRLQREIRTFSTMTADLLALADWLAAQQVTHVALESTGVYWKPVFNLLEEGHTIILVNPQHMKAVPGHKTDVRDSEWLADLLRHDLVRPSFIPPAPIRELREVTRYRKSLVEARAREVNRVQKVLEGANLKLASVATDVTLQERAGHVGCPHQWGAGSRRLGRVGPWTRAEPSALSSSRRWTVGY
jgi:transposase